MRKLAFIILVLLFAFALWLTTRTEPAVAPISTETSSPTATSLSGVVREAGPGIERDAMAAPSEARPAEFTPEGRTAGALLVRVVDEKDNPVPMVGIVITPFDGRSPVIHGRTSATDAQGVARIDDLPAEKAKIRLDRGTTRIVAVRPGAITDVKFALPSGTTVEGSVVDAQGQPIPNATIWVRRRAGNSFGEPVGRSEADGTFRLRCLALSTFVGATAPGLAASAMQPVARSTYTPQNMKFVLGFSCRQDSGTRARCDRPAARGRRHPNRRPDRWPRRDHCPWNRAPRLVARAAAQRERRLLRGHIRATG